jgi:hypothetical protein
VPGRRRARAPECTRGECCASHWVGGPFGVSAPPFDPTAGARGGAHGKAGFGRPGAATHTQRSQLVPEQSQARSLDRDGARPPRNGRSERDRTAPSPAHAPRRIPGTSYTSIKSAAARVQSGPGASAHAAMVQGRCVHGKDCLLVDEGQHGIKLLKGEKETQRSCCSPCDVYQVRLPWACYARFGSRESFSLSCPRPAACSASRPQRSKQPDGEVDVIRLTMFKGLAKAMRSKGRVRLERLARPQRSPHSSTSWSCIQCMICCHPPLQASVKELATKEVGIDVSSPVVVQQHAHVACTS